MSRDAAPEPAGAAEPDQAAGDAPAAQTAPAAEAGSPPSASPPRATVGSQAPAQSHVRVDARLLEAALLDLWKRIAAIPLVFEIADPPRSRPNATSR